MNPETAEIFIRHFAIKYFAHILPPDVVEHIKNQSTTDCYTIETQALVQNWDQKISVQAHWEGVIEAYQSQKIETWLGIYKDALYQNQQLLLHSEEHDQTKTLFNPFGLVIRNENYYFVGSFGDSQNPELLSLDKLLDVQRTDKPALSPLRYFNLEKFAVNYLNHPITPEIIDELVVEFPIKAYFYVKSHPIKCENLTLTKPQDTPGYFKLEAKNVRNTNLLHQWFAGFHDDAQILEPIYLRKLINRSFVDQLTNLYNRKAFDRLGHREIEQSLRHPQHFFSILVMDIDHFKKINDHHGHVFGDDVLIRVSECFRGYDAIRYGGEEFVVLLSNTSAENARKSAERIRNEIASLQLKNDSGKQVAVTISIGIAEFPRHLPESDKSTLSGNNKIKLSDNYKNSLMIAITEQADKALYQAKSNGRNQSIIFNATQ